MLAVGSGRYNWLALGPTSAARRISLRQRVLPRRRRYFPAV